MKKCVKIRIQNCSQVLNLIKKITFNFNNILTTYTILLSTVRIFIFPFILMKSISFHVHYIYKDKK